MYRIRSKGGEEDKRGEVVLEDMGSGNPGRRSGFQLVQRN